MNKYRVIVRKNPSNPRSKLVKKIIIAESGGVMDGILKFFNKSPLIAYAPGMWTYFELVGKE